MWLLSQVCKNTEYLRNIFFPEAFLFMRKKMPTLRKRPVPPVTITTALACQCHPDKSL